jgi:acetyl/propionyl-CoA carboxylase alpha subunit
MPLTKILIANRGEIAVRVARAASVHNIATVGVYAPDDAGSGHVAAVDIAVELSTEGPAGYLAADEMIAIARQHGCDGVHPGYGFLSERASFADAVMRARLIFIGPTVEALTMFGDKERARASAVLIRVPVLAGTGKSISVDEAEHFMESLGPGSAVMIKAVAGGGGRGIRVIRARSELESALTRASSEASKAFGDGSLYLEQFLVGARHVEVQILGDGTGGIAVLGERECSVQRRHQKLIEIAPAPNLSNALRTDLFDAARRLGAAANYVGIGTVEFLVDVANEQFFFIEANARLQVEHTVTEMVTGLDLVGLQFAVANGATLADLGLLAETSMVTKGFAIQTRICAERTNASGLTEPTNGVISAFDPPIGEGLRVDTHAYVGYEMSPRYDSLLAKLVVHSESDQFADCVEKAKDALAGFRIEGLETNLATLQRILTETEFVSGTYTTQLFDDRTAAFHDQAVAGAPSSGSVGVVVDSNDPLAVLDLGRAAVKTNPTMTRSVLAVVDGVDASAADENDVLAPMQGTIIAVEATVGDVVTKGSVLVVMEAMKMEHEAGATDGSGHTNQCAHRNNGGERFRSCVAEPN